jgi:hypothetical protein
MDRIAAAEAKEEMDGRLINGHELRTGWGKCVPTLLPTVLHLRVA